MKPTLNIINIYNKVGIKVIVIVKVVIKAVPCGVNHIMSDIWRLDKMFNLITL